MRAYIQHKFKILEEFCIEISDKDRSRIASSKTKNEVDRVVRDLICPSEEY